MDVEKILWHLALEHQQKPWQGSKEVHDIRITWVPSGVVREGHKGTDAVTVGGSSILYQQQ